jgi:hypothetical protein
VPFETAVMQWQDGLRRLSEAPPEQQRVLERVTRALEAELRRRLGGAFTSDELAEFYERGTDWATDLAVSVARRYLRSATDYAGGRRRPID